MSERETSCQVYQAGTEQTMCSEDVQTDNVKTRRQTNIMFTLLYIVWIGALFPCLVLLEILGIYFHLNLVYFMFFFVIFTFCISLEFCIVFRYLRVSLDHFIFTLRDVSYS